MNLIEAVKSGKTCISTQKGYIHRLIPGETHTFTKQDLNADWEIEERKIEITESEFDEACNGLGPVVPSNAIRELKKRLFEK